MSVEWVDEVPERRRVGRWTLICEQLRERPGQWARVHTGTSTAFATMLKQGKLGDAEPGEFEAVSRRVSGGYDVYARYVGVPNPRPMRPLRDAYTDAEATDLRGMVV